VILAPGENSTFNVRSDLGSKKFSSHPGRRYSGGVEYRHNTIAVISVIELCCEYLIQDLSHSIYDVIPKSGKITLSYLIDASIRPRHCHHQADFID